MLNIVFGALKTPGSRSREGKSKYDFPVMTIEKNRGPKTSRRIFFNHSASELLEMTKGFSQEMLFGFAVEDDNNLKRLFIINTEKASNLVENKTYKTSKNYTKFFDTDERGKAISSKVLVKDIINHLALSNYTDDENIEFKISEFEKDNDTGFVLFEIKEYLCTDTEPTNEGTVETEETVQETVYDEDVI